MDLIKKIQLDDFLKKNPSMSIKPSRNDDLIVEGRFYFKAKTKGHKEIDYSYRIRIIIPSSFPLDIPEVIELENEIPKTADFHVNTDDTLCLGSKLRLLRLLNKNPTLNGYIEYCLVPFLYSVYLKIKCNEEFVFGELAHEMQGIVDDYMKIFGVGKETIKKTLEMIALNKRVANKKSCPCECGKRLGKCKFKLHLKINEFRKYAPRSYYDKYIQSWERKSNCVSSKS